jgi:hypothetical protein
MFHRNSICCTLQTIACLCISVMLSFTALSYAEITLGTGAGGMITSYSSAVSYSTSSADMAPFGPVGSFFVRKDFRSNFCLRADYNFAYLLKSMLGAKSNSFYESIELKPCFNLPLAKGSRASVNVGAGPNLGGFFDYTSWADDFTQLYQNGAKVSGNDRAAGMIAGVCAYAMLRFKRIELGPILSVNGNFVFWKDREVIAGKSNSVYNPGSGMTFQAQLSVGFPVGCARTLSANKQES